MIVMAKKTLLLTGASGMVGRNILEHPAAKDWAVLAPSTRELDLTDARATEHYVTNCKPELVIHAAGRVGGIQANIAHPIDFLERNLTMGRNIIMAAYRSGVRNFLNLASTCMYPRKAQNPLREEMILSGELEPTNEGYALAKIMTTRLCQYICHEDQYAQYKTIIPCNQFGRHDKFDPKHSHLIPAIIHKIHFAKKNGQKKVEIWGDGTARREFMYAGDLADAVMKAANDMKALPEIMNCGLGEDTTINKYYEIVAEVIGWDGEFTHNLSKPVGMERKLCAIDRQASWGWEAKTLLRDGIKATYEFYLNGAAR